MSVSGSTLTTIDFGLGLVVSTVGDFNGDGNDDFIVAGRTTPDEAGGAYLVYGDEDGLPQTVDLDTIGADEGFAIGGADAGDMLGFSVRNAGDVNGDGFDDVILGAPGVDTTYTNIYTRYDGYTRFYTSYIPVTYTYTYTGYTTYGAAYSETRTYVGGYTNFSSYYYGTAIPYTYTYTSGNAGKAYVIFGTDTGPTSINVNDMAGDGIAISGFYTGQMIGTQVAGVSDFNGDGVDDIAVSQSGTTGIAERVYIVFGDDSGGLDDLDLDAFGASDGILLESSDVGSGFGLSMAASGDINGDGFGDVVVGASNADTFFTYTGLSYGGFYTFYTNFIPYTNSYTYFGSTYSGATYTEIRYFYGSYSQFYSTYVPMTYTNTYTGSAASAGSAYVFFGSDALPSGPILKDDLSGANGFTFSGTLTGDNVGADVAMVGDINGDGYDDVLIGATGVSGGNGAAYVVLGGAHSFAATLTHHDLDGSLGFVVNGDGLGAGFGRTVAGVGDVNGDGIDDFMIADTEGGTTGRAHLFFGTTLGQTSAGISASDINGVSGYTFEFTGGLDPTEFATEISGSDVNGDGVSDIIIGSSGPNDAASALVIAGDTESFAFMDGLDGVEDGIINVEHYLEPRVAGTSGGDRLFGDGFDAMMHGLSGDDTMNGGTGNDTIQSAADADLVYGGDGSDSILAGYGEDTVFGGNGADFIRGGRSHDVLQGNAGHDTMYGDKGHDDLSGNNGHDVLNGSGGNDILRGNNGHDTLLGGAGKDTLMGGNGKDILSGGTGADVLFDGLGVDELTGGADADVFRFVSDGLLDTVHDFEAGIDLLDVGYWSVTAASLTIDYLVDGSVELSGGGELLKVFGAGGSTLDASNFSATDILF